MAIATQGEFSCLAESGKPALPYTQVALPPRILSLIIGVSFL
jgi:hypothetical protein